MLALLLEASSGTQLISGEEGLPALGGSAPLTLLPQHQGDHESAACLDGSPYGFYYVPATNPASTSWTIFLQGGGWCEDEVSCTNKLQTDRGSSHYFPAMQGCNSMNVAEDGTIDQEAHCIFMPYCDGASFSGYRGKPWPVPGSSASSLTFRGIRNLDATVEWALTRLGLDGATQFVLTGESAGGLSTFIHADRVISRVRAASAGLQAAWAAPVVGFFLDHAPAKQATSVPNTPSWAHASYMDWIRYIYGMQNISVAPGGALSAACVRTYGNAPHLCLMPSHLGRFVETPLFLFASKFDLWQLAHELQVAWDEPANQPAVRAYGEDFMSQLQAVAGATANGGVITSCVCHLCPWQQLTNGSRSAVEHYTEWATARMHAASPARALRRHKRLLRTEDDSSRAIRPSATLRGPNAGDQRYWSIDSRGPNGDGEVDIDAQPGHATCADATGPVEHLFPL